jgi:hypothetical protein
VHGAASPPPRPRRDADVCSCAAPPRAGAAAAGPSPCAADAATLSIETLTRWRPPSTPRRTEMGTEEKEVSAIREGLATPALPLLPSRRSSEGGQ